jgi:hypothetical protein
MTSEEPTAELLGADAAKAAADKALEAIEEAAARNADPVVADKLDEAAAKADTASGRIGWLRALLRRRFGTRR